MNRAEAINEASNDDPLQSFRDWQKASAVRRVAEARGEGRSDIVSAEVIPMSNALPLDLRTGRNAPQDIVRHLTLDDLLLCEKDAAGR